jgi:hypothetical protein
MLKILLPDISFGRKNSNVLICIQMLEIQNKAGIGLRPSCHMQESPPGLEQKRITTIE